MSFVTIWGTTQRIKENNMFLFQLNSQTISHHNPIFKIIHSIKVFNLSLLSVCCSVIFLYHTLIHAPHSLEKIQKHTSKKYGNTKIQNMQSRYCTALYFCFTALISVGFGNVAPNTDAEKLYAIVMMLLGCESSQFTLESRFAPKLFGVHPWFGRHPPSTWATTNWLSLSWLVVVNLLHTPQH